MPKNINLLYRVVLNRNGQYSIHVESKLNKSGYVLELVPITMMSKVLNDPTIVICQTKFMIDDRSTERNEGTEVAIRFRTKYLGADAPDKKYFESNIDIYNKSDDSLISTNSPSDVVEYLNSNNFKVVECKSLNRRS